MRREGNQEVHNIRLGKLEAWLLGRKTTVRVGEEWRNNKAGAIPDSRARDNI